MEEIPSELPTPEPPPRPSKIAFSEADVSTRYDDVYQTVASGEVVSVRKRDDVYEFSCRNGVSMRIQALSQQIFRLRYSPDGEWERDFSYGISPQGRREKTELALQKNTNEYLLSTPQMQIVVSRQGMKLRFFDADDRVLCEDADGYSATRTVMDGWNDLRISKKCHKKEVFYGLGDKTCSANLHGKTLENWCTDAFAFGRDTDPLYRAVPFYYSLYQGAAYGIFFDNTFRTRFDFNSQSDGKTTFSAEGGEINYYFIYGPSLDDVARAYAQLTGVHALPPLWALGYHQCRWSYYPESRVLHIAEVFRALKIPCDAIYLDIDYMDEYRCFTWDKAHFPDPRRLVGDLRAKGFQTVVMIDPGLKEDPAYGVYRDALERNFLTRTADGRVAKAPVWPGFCAFPDFTRAEVREWWGDLYADLYHNIGISGFWNDMNEPAVFHINHKTLPDHVMHAYDGDPCSHRKAHNIYGQQMNRASWEGLQRLLPDKRPFLLTRATYSGGQRFAAVWTGDNVADWDHLQIANLQCQNLSISGFSFCGTDIGGFAGTPDGELFVRWLQLGVFHPLMRVHTMGEKLAGDTVATAASDDAPEKKADGAEKKTKSGQKEAEAGAALDFDERKPSASADTNRDITPATLLDPPSVALPNPVGGDQEPWSFGEKWTNLARKAIELRYHMLPSLYTAMWLHYKEGAPAIRRLAFADQNDPKLWEQERDFLFGEHILVSPVVLPKIHRQLVYLPKGNWYYFWTGQSAVGGEMFVNVMPDQIPFFIKEGAVLATYPVRQWVNEKPVDELTLYVYYKNGRESSRLYEDAGEGYDYLSGDYSLQTFDTDGTERSFELRVRREGNWTPPYQQVKIYLVGFPAFARQCRVDGETMPIKEIRLRDRTLYTLTLSPNFNTVVWSV